MKAKENGFTLVELLTAITIIGILSSLSLANLNEYKGEAYHAIAKSAMANARTSLESRIIGDPDFTYIAVVIEKDSSLSTLTSGESVQSILPGYEHTTGVVVDASAFGTLSGSTQRTVYTQHCNGPLAVGGNNKVWHWSSLDSGVSLLTERDDITHSCG